MFLPGHVPGFLCISVCAPALVCPHRQSGSDCLSEDGLHSDGNFSVIVTSDVVQCLHDMQEKSIAMRKA
jgi:hypothetical protein